MEVPLSTEICRCCLAPGNYKSLKDTFQWMGQNENYGDMLKECFNVTLCDANDSCHGGICELCITQLRNARNFKKQVLKSDEIFKQGLDNNFKGEEVKIEFLNENDLDSDTGNQDDYFAGLETEEETEVPVKEEITVATKSRKRTVERKAPVKNDAPAKKKKPEGETSGKGERRKREAGPEGKRRNSGRKLSAESNKRRHNLLTILELTNATPIKNKVGRGYECVYCAGVFLDPNDLKMHTVQEHGEDKIKYKYFKKMLYANSAKLDITSLECTLCHVQMGGLSELYRHLNKEHDKKIYTDIKDKLLPFKFDERDVARCVICSETFASFKMLLSHMNIHYRNYICDVCETGFVTERLLKSHFRESHQRGEYKCDICEKVFSTITKKKDHEKCVHFGLKKNKCPYCPARFVNYIKKNAHISEVHNKPSIVYNCHACEKSFDAHVKLSTHIKRDHLMERKYECTECDMNFFEKDSLTEHMVKHTGEKGFACGVCYKTFGRKKTLREHMRIHNNDRRFKCEECAHAFVQKCAWRSHMKTKHNISV